ncbi:endoplasmic reticulum membrane protein complex subunit 7 [Petromyzon marinus]|uniref:endoplasmic reticulum membrane protein complex subunit 7 n=1 Tax=Petromyzon marinus TaxID=7757 RepID=UPI003F70D4B4
MAVLVSTLLVVLLAGGAASASSSSSVSSSSFSYLEAEDANGERFKIEGRVSVPGFKMQEWISGARVLVEGGEYVGLLRTDGSFTVHNVPSGSYVVEVASPSFKFDPVRVDITTKGKIRARKLNYIKSSEVVPMPYPLRMRAFGTPNYFMKRETWKWTDFLFNPMVLMMALPLLIVFLLPKVMNTNDPEMRKEMEQSMNMLTPNKDLPDVSELMTRIFTTKKAVKSSGSTKVSKPGPVKRR